MHFIITFPTNDKDLRVTTLNPFDIQENPSNRFSIFSGVERKKISKGKSKHLPARMGKSWMLSARKELHKVEE
jgi:hypothetical protein